MCVIVDKNVVGLYSKAVTKVVCNSVGASKVFVVVNMCVKLHMSGRQ